MVRIAASSFVLLMLFTVSSIDAKINFNSIANEQTVMTNLSSIPLAITENLGQCEKTK